MLYNILLFIHCAACALLILVVLVLQTGRGAGLNVFGGGTDSLIQTPSGSGFVKNFTGILAGTFAFTSLFLTLLSGRAGLTSVTSRVQPPPPPAQQAPQAPSGSVPVEPAPKAPKKPAK